MTSESTQQSEPWTVLRLLEWTTDYFKQKGSDTPRLDAEVLLAEARGCSRIQLYTDFQSELADEARVAFRELVRRRGEGAPVAYLVGYKEFYSLRFRVDESVLIPRPDTEHLVIKTLDLAKAFADDAPLRIADVGTGSGAIAIALAKALPAARILATDQSEAALRIAGYNAKQHEVSDRVVLKRGDLLEPLKAPGSLDFVCSNPPYVSEAEYAELDPSVRDFEPREALVAGPRGTEVIERLLPAAIASLKPGGAFLIELSPMIASACVERARQQPGVVADSVELVKDLAGQQRVLWGRKTNG